MFKTTHPVAARRAALATAGLVLIAGMVCLVLSAFLDHSAIAQVSPYTILGGAWLAALGAGVVSYVVAGMRSHDEPMAAGRSFVLFSVGVALIAPLTLHAIANVVLSGTARLASFREWVQLSLVITSTAHIAFAAMVGVRASKLARGERAQSTWSVYLATIAVSAFPFAVLWGLPPVLVGITGLFLLPAVKAMERYAAHDRDSASTVVPTARVIA